MGCGPSLEYEPDYLLLMARMAPREEVQYGSFVGNAAAPDWASLEREVLRLLALSQDITLLVCLCRAATRLRQGAGLAGALRQLLEALERWPEALHPQTMVDGVHDRTVRANALAALADPAGLVGDVAGIVLSPGLGPSITLAAIEAAFAIPRQPGLPDATALAASLVASADAETTGSSAEKPFGALARAAIDAAAIDRWARQALGDEAPDLQGLLRLLAPFATARPRLEDRRPSLPGSAPDLPLPPLVPVPMPSLAMLPPASGQPARTRADMRALLAEARSWFETFEPSSPVAVLLAQAENLIGKRFAQVAQSIPPDLLRQWEAAATAAAADAGSPV